MRPEPLHFRDIRNTSTFRLTLMLGLVFAIGMVALLGLIYTLSARELNARSDRIILLQAQRFRGVPSARLAETVAVEIAHSTSGLNYFALLSPQGRWISGNLDPPRRIAFGHVHDVPAVAGKHGPLRLLAIRAGAGEVVLVGRDIAPIVDLRHRMLKIMTASVVAITFAIFAAGVALSLAPLRRVRDMRRASGEIAAGNLAVRMPILGRGDELDLFAGTVNTMVEEVGHVIAQVKGVTDAVAHDLRTPLTRVRSQLYRTLRHPDILPELAQRIDAAIGDLDTVLDRFAALLRIAELEAGNRHAGFAPVALGPLIASVCDLYEPLAEERGITLTVDRGTTGAVEGDRHLLFEAVGNLVDNAIKFADAGGQVTVRVGRNNRAEWIEVRDDGPGIAPDQHKAVLRRFHRGAGTEAVAGSGLGLSVVAAIAHLHQFTLEFSDAAPGLIVRITCPDRDGDR